MASVGKVLRIPERQQDAVTAISGSGPAYIFFVVESMIEAGVHLGLPRATATELVIQTLVGSAKMLRETGTHPTVLREQVTSPGGTTASALARARDPQGARRVPGRDGGRPRPLPPAGRGRLACPCHGCRSSGARAAEEVARRYPADELSAGRAGADPRHPRGRPARADLAVAVPDRGGAVLLRLDRQPRPPEPPGADARRGRAPGRPDHGRRVPAGVVRRAAPVDRDHHPRGSGCSAGLR